MSRSRPNLLARYLSVFALLLTFSSSAQALDLVSMLTDQLGVTSEQALGGAGSIFGYVKDNLSEDDFATVSKGVPEMDSMLAAAPEPESKSTMGQVSNMLGSSSSLGGLASLASSFEALGLDAEMVNKFLPIVNEYIGSVSGEQALGLLKGLF